MKSIILTQVIKLFISLLSPEMLVKFADYVLDWIEDQVLGTSSAIDDKLVLPLVSMMRETFNIPDNDE